MSTSLRNFNLSLSIYKLAPAEKTITCPSRKRLERLPPISSKFLGTPQHHVSFILLKTKTRELRRLSGRPFANYHFQETDGHQSGSRKKEKAGKDWVTRYSRRNIINLGDRVWSQNTQVGEKETGGRSKSAVLNIARAPCVCIWETRGLWLRRKKEEQFHFRAESYLPPPFPLVFLSTRSVPSAQRPHQTDQALIPNVWGPYVHAQRLIQQDQLQLICLISHLFSPEKKRSVRRCMGGQNNKRERKTSVEHSWMLGIISRCIDQVPLAG